jgi:hypothetical protein
MKRFALLVAAALAAGQAWADDPAPRSAPPEFVYLSAVDKDKGTIRVREAVSVPVQVPVTMETVVNGQKVVVTRTVTRLRTEFREPRTPFRATIRSRP